MYSKDKDFDLKIRFQKIFWKMGYWTRIEIPILHYSYDQTSDIIKRTDLTDIDVYGEAINPDFSIHKYVGDCKSGSNVKVVERTFWLKGIMEYTSASKGYLVKKSISNNIRPILDELNIYAVSLNDLMEIEKIYDVKSLNYFYDKNYYEERALLIDSLTDEYLKIYQYLSSRYWFDANNINLKTILSMLSKNDFYKQFSAENKLHKFLLLEIIILLSRILIDCCSYIIHRGIQQIDKALLDYIHGGVDNYNTKINIIKQIRPVIRKITNEENLLNEVLITPPYYKSLLRLTKNIISDPINYIDIVRYIEILQYEIIMEKRIEFNDIFGAGYSDIKLKVAKDIISFYLKEVNINEEVLKDVLYR